MLDAVRPTCTVHVCGASFFRRLSSTSQNQPRLASLAEEEELTEVSTAAPATNQHDARLSGPQPGAKLLLHGRSLLYLLSVLLRRLQHLQAQSMETRQAQALQDCMMILQDVHSRWGRDPRGFAGSLREADPRLQQACSSTYYKCKVVLAAMTAPAADSACTYQPLPRPQQGQASSFGRPVLPGPAKCRTLTYKAIAQCV